MNKELTNNINDVIPGDVKKTRTPLQYDSIERGALKLTLQERATLCAKLKASINTEMVERDKQAAEAKKIAEGL